MSTPQACPACHVSLQDVPIPPVHREKFGNASHFSRVIGLSNGDRQHTWKCPDCGHEWSRTEPSGRGFRTFNTIVLRQ